MNTQKQPQTILIPVDFSDSSLAVLDYAVPFVNKMGAKAVLLNVVETPLVPLELYGLKPDFKTLVETSMKNLETIARANFPERDNFFVNVKKGHADEEIIKAVKEYNCDLIIMSTHGHRGFEHLLIGSTAERVVRTSPVPVLTVKPKS